MASKAPRGENEASVKESDGKEKAKAGQADEDVRFQKLRERYDMVHSLHKARIDELRYANKKIKGLQEEIDLLLEAFIEGTTQTPLLRFEAPPPTAAPPEEPQDSSWRPSPLPQPLPQPGSGNAALIRVSTSDAPIHPHALSNPGPVSHQRTVANGKRSRGEESPEDDKSKRRRRTSRKRSPADDDVPVAVEGDADTRRMAFINELIDP
ncbi:hypothetical protein Moror_17041 [Moniliophthora roreri MCA 2997]|uniref:Uncharacterized protein n=1 Tax=Moniliophthora roreri (strain MCA 2997) TaxID=1381753 RepID=V2YAZ0_MONRO|nr:hypothetical protein Moror_17041 [Moniliophthora roreri MCA 2997]